MARIVRQGTTQEIDMLVLQIAGGILLAVFVLYGLAHAYAI